MPENYCSVTDFACAAHFFCTLRYIVRQRAYVICDAIIYSKRPLLRLRPLPSNNELSAVKAHWLITRVSQTEISEKQTQLNGVDYSRKGTLYRHLWFIRVCNINRLNTSTCLHFLHFILYIVYNIVDCWIQTSDVHGFGGISKNLATLEECQAACMKYTKCVAIDWEPSNVGRSCWILPSTAARETTRRGVIAHYELRRACRS